MKRTVSEAMIDLIIFDFTSGCVLIAMFIRSAVLGGYKTKTEDLRPKNEDPFKIVLKSLEKGSNMIPRNKEQQNMRFSVNLPGVFVTLPNVQNEDPFKIVLKSLSKGSHMILDRSRNKEL